MYLSLVFWFRQTHILVSDCTGNCKYCLQAARSIFRMFLEWNGNQDTKNKWGTVTRICTGKWVN